MVAWKSCRSPSPCLLYTSPGVVKIYACGPTVYNFIHIGNARPLCVFDVLRRYLEWRGYEVRFVQNFTDIDDKIIRRANEEGVSYDVIAQRYIEEFWKDAKGCLLYTSPSAVCWGWSGGTNGRSPVCSSALFWAIRGS